MTSPGPDGLLPPLSSASTSSLPPSLSLSLPPDTSARWEPLPKIHYGFAVTPFSPDAEVMPQAAEILDEASAAALQAHLIALEVGDEVYVFEHLATEAVAAAAAPGASTGPAAITSPSSSSFSSASQPNAQASQQNGPRAEWFRGYVVSTNRMPTTAATASSLSNYSPFPGSVASGAEAALVEEPQVFVGVFPSAHVHIREHLDDAETRLADMYAKAQEQGHAASSLQPPHSASGSLAKPQMETLPEEDENVASMPNSPSVTPSSASQARMQQQQRRRHSLALGPDGRDGESRPPPPLPSLKCGDETVSGASEPLVDEIACAIREWSSLMYTYLARRDYATFAAVRGHIDVLHVARRQLLAQTLSEDEVAKLRRECVARLVKGNVAQGLDVIVRHPTRGGLVNIDFTGKDIDVDNWVSGIRLYALQVALAYVDHQHEAQGRGQGAGHGGFGHGHLSGLAAFETTASNAFGIVSPMTTRDSILAAAGGLPFKRQTRLSLTGTGVTGSGTRSTYGIDGGGGSTSIDESESARAKYFHVFLDVRAFLASPCSPGETVELYFSLYNKAEARFLTEEYCVILNHHGVPARKADERQTKMCTLFTDLSPNDMQDLNIVCRIVRNGAMRLGSSGDQKLTPANPDEGLQSPTSARSADTHDGPLSALPGFRHKRMVGDRTFRRPFGCAVLSLGQDHHFEIDVTNSSVKKEHVMPIFVPVNEAAFSTLHQDIIASRIREFEKSPRAEMIAVDVKVFHGEMQSLLRENPSILTGAALTARLGFPDVVFPGDQRNEAYIKLWSGEFYPASNKMPGGSTPKNIQVSIEVRTRNGNVLENVISRGSGEPSVTQFDSTIFYHQNAPTWGELIKLELPREIMEQCHLFLSFRHRSTKEEKMSLSQQGAPSSTGSVTSAAGRNDSLSLPFAHAYLPLFGSNSAFIQDGSHTLLLWRSSRPAQQLSPELYFSLPATISTGKPLGELVPASLTNIIQPLRDTITLRSFLVSTRYTQNDVLLRLLHWERALSEDFEELKSVLVKFTFVGEVEIVKFLGDIFDALFAIVVNPRNSSGELDDLVFNALVTVLGIVQDRRFNNFRATLDVYIDKHFHSQTAHTRLMASMARLLADPARSDTSKELRASIKVWPYLFKFIIRSRENQRRANDAGNSLGGGAVGDHFETRFRSELDALLRSINRLMSATKPPSIVGTQALALQHFAGILPDLARVYDAEELVRYEAAFADSIFVTKGRMVVWKLLHIVQVTAGPLFEGHAPRSQLIPSIVRWIRPHLGSYMESAEAMAGEQESARDTARITWMESARLAITVLAITLDRLQTSLLHGRRGEMTPAELRQEQDNVDYILSMVPRILETYKELESKASIKALERHRAPSTVASTIPVIFPSSYPFPLIAKRPEGHPALSPTSRSRRFRQGDRFEFLNCGLGEIAAILTMLVMLSPRKHLAGFLEEQLDLEGPERLAKFLNDFFDVATSILVNEAYPSSWLSINILAHQMVLKMADPLAALMVRDFIPPAEESNTFDTNLWKSCLNMLLTLLSSEQLVIEQFKPQRRRAVWRLAGDIRGEGAQIFAKLWNSIGWPDRPSSANGGAPSAADPERLNTGGFQVQFVPSLVEPVLELCLSHHDELRTCAVRVLATMITSEWHLNGSFSVIEAEIIDKLDVLFMADTKGDEISRAFFIGQLRSLFESPEVDPKLQEQVFACLVSVNRFLDLLLSVRNLPLEEGYEDDRIAGTLKLLGFLRQANRVTAFSTHVLRLVNLHLSNHNYVEAALTLKLHADLHTWDMDSFVDPIAELSLPRQSHFARRETLYMLILDYLGKGQAWEISVDICRELAQQYEYRAVDYSRLSEVLTYQASLFRKIATTERVFPAYFRVAYYGEQWPQSLQQKMFVYRGLDWEKYPAFCERLHQKHPSAILLKTDRPPSDDIRFADAQYLQITALQPEPDRSRDVFTNPEVPPTVKSYYEHNATSHFSYTRPLVPYDENESAQEVDPADLWVEKTFLRCEDAFPTVLRRSEVAEVHVVEISPLENALNDVETKSEELVALEKKYAALEEVGAVAGKVNTNRLAMALNSTVDAPANGGIPLYKRAFFSEDFLAANADKQETLGRLSDAINQQAMIIFRCIKLHARLCPPEMKPFHETLARFFNQNFAEEIEKLGLNLDSADSNEASGQKGSMDEGRDAQGGEYRSAYHMTSSGGMKLGRTGPGGAQASSSGRAAGGPSTYALDGNSRLQKVKYDPQEAIAQAQSPLQKHIAFLAKQAQGPIPAPSSLEAAPANVAPTVRGRAGSASTGTVAASPGPRTGAGTHDAGGVGGAPAQVLSLSSILSSHNAVSPSPSSAPRSAPWSTNSNSRFDSGGDDGRSLRDGQSPGHGQGHGGGRTVSIFSSRNPDKSDSNGSGGSGNRLSRFMSVRKKN